MLTEPGRDRAGEWAMRVLPFLIVAASFSITLFEAVGAVFVVLCAASFWRTRRPGPVTGIFAWLALAYFASVVLSLTQTEHLSTSIRGVTKIGRGLILAASVAYTLDSAERRKTACLWFCAAAFFVSVDAFVQAATGRELLGRTMTAYHGATQRVTGPFKHANDLSAYLAPVICLWIACMPRARRLFGRFAPALYAGLPFAALILLWTYSRAGWLSAAAGVLFWTALSRNRVAIALVAFVAVWAFFLSPPMVRLRLNSMTDPRGSIAERRELWGQSLRMIRSSPVFGLGSNTYAKNQPHFKKPGSTLDDQYAHNGYLQIAAETGLTGLAAFLALLGATLFGAAARFARARDDEPALTGAAFAAALVAACVHGFFDTNLQSVLLVGNLWMLLGALAAASHAARPAR